MHADCPRGDTVIFRSILSPEEGGALVASSSEQGESRRVPVFHCLWGHLGTGLIFFPFGLVQIRCKCIGFKIRNFSLFITYFLIGPPAVFWQVAFSRSSEILPFLKTKTIGAEQSLRVRETKGSGVGPPGSGPAPAAASSLRRDRLHPLCCSFHVPRTRVSV